MSKMVLPWGRLLIIGLALVLGGLVVPRAPLSGAFLRLEAAGQDVPALHVRLVLLAGRNISAGASTSGYVVVDNTGMTPVTVSQGCGGRPDIAVILSSPTVRQEAAFAAVKCPDLDLGPGRHFYPVDISASYQACSGSGGNWPPCLPAPRNGPPSLPVGRYQAVMETASSIPTAKPISVNVVHPKPNPTAYRDSPLATTLTVPALEDLEKIATDEARLNGDASVHRGYIIMTTRENAVAPDIVNSDQPVYQVVIQGHFTCGSCSFPPGAKVPTGTVITSTVDRRTLQGLDFGLTRARPKALVGEPVYEFRF